MEGLLEEQLFNEEIASNLIDCSRKSFNSFPFDCNEENNMIPGMSSVPC